jgi:hypothetical protein
MLLDFEFMTLAQVTEFSLRFGPAIIHGARFTAVSWMIAETDVQYLRFAPVFKSARGTKS